MFKVFLLITLILLFPCHNCLAWRFRGFYGEHDVSLRKLAWRKLKDLAKLFSIPWSGMGDLIEILGTYEYEGGGDRGHRQMKDFS